MAIQEIVTFVDDLDGTATDDVVTVQFGLDGVEYEIDLKPDHRERLFTDLEEFVSHARRTGGRKRTTSANGGQATKDPEQGRAVREWARANGWETLGERGRIPRDAQIAFDEAHMSKPAAPRKATEAKPATRARARKQRAGAKVTA